MISNTTIAPVRYSDEELLEFKALINEKLDKAYAEQLFLRDQIMELNESGNNQQSGDWTDESSNHTEIELLNAMMSRQRQFIQNLQNALMRIQNKSYGICSITGQLIDKKRLLLVPHATKTVAGKESRTTAPHPTANHAANANRETSEQDWREPDQSDSSTTMAKEFFDNE
jgi:DnaK suppressor protein